MIILDTNVVSALMQQQPDATVVDWLDRQPAEYIWLNAIAVFETRYGLALLPNGQRKIGLPPQSHRPTGGYARHLHCRHCAGTPSHLGHSQHQTL